MRSALVSATFIGLLALAAGGQPHPAPKPVPPKPPALEDDIAKALRSHPDVLVAEAEAQLANAKLLQSKLAVAGKVTAAKREIDRAKLDAGLAETRIRAAIKTADVAGKQFDETKKLNQRAVVSVIEVQVHELAHEKAKLAVVEAEQALQGAKLTLAAAEAEYDALVGKSVRFSVPLVGLPDKSKPGHEDRGGPPVPVFVDPAPGSAADALRTALNKPLAYESKKQTLEELVKGLKTAAGLKVVIRVPAGYKPTFDFDKQELTLAAWLELFRDEFNDAHKDGPMGGQSFEWYVREYGLILSANGRPEGAMTLAEFLKAIGEPRA